MAKRQLTWEELVLYSGIILAVILLFKILFWLSLLAIIVGVIWLIINLINKEDTDEFLIPAILIVGGIILGFISYHVGYGFEKSEIGKPIVDTARVVIDTDKQIDKAKYETMQQITNSLDNLNET